MLLRQSCADLLNDVKRFLLLLLVRVAVVVAAVAVAVAVGSVTATVGVVDDGVDFDWWWYAVDS